MGYDEKFYKAYKAFLKEPAVRQAHDWVLGVVKDDGRFQHVVDFGCGQFCEYHQYARPKEYVGIDVNATDPNIRVDYRTCDLKATLKNWLYEPTAFVSLFSTEITDSYTSNYAFYERLFRTLPFQAGLVSGFYYASSKSSPIVFETGGLVSYQTTESPEEVRSLLFSEKRIILPVPSRMFGSDVYEVWKLFERT